MFCCPYNHKSFRALAEPVSDLDSSCGVGTVSRFLSSTSKELELWLIAGSVPESVVLPNGQSKLYNTSFVYESHGRIVSRYRKLHLFDVNITAESESSTQAISFRESDTFSPGDLGLGLVPTPFGFDVGLGICYDMRFPELAERLRARSRGSMKMLVYPGQFNMITGPLHWELLGRARAVDTQSFCILASVARSDQLQDYQVCDSFKRTLSA
jgi:omega-amidase